MDFDPNWMIAIATGLAAVAAVASAVTAVALSRLARKQLEETRWGHTGIERVLRSEGFANAWPLLREIWDAGDTAITAPIVEATMECYGIASPQRIEAGEEDASK